LVVVQLAIGWLAVVFMGYRRIISRRRQRRHFAYLFQVADDAMQMDVTKRFTLSTP